MQLKSSVQIFQTFREIAFMLPSVTSRSLALIGHVRVLISN